MYHPTTRVLTVLELLQTHQRITGPELAARLEVNTRTARRYITMLQDMGIPVEGERGRYGAYRLQPNFKLPPLMFSEDEALAVTLGLLAARRLSLATTAPAVEGALAKIERMLPPPLRERLQAVEATLAFDLGQPETPPTSESVVTLSNAAQHGQQVQLCYRSEHGHETERVIDPYGLVYRQGRWYTVGHCHLRDELRVFRLDRVREARACATTFTPPTGFNCVEYVVRSIAMMPNTWRIVVLLKAPFERVQWVVPPIMGLLEVTDAGVLLVGYADNLDWMARDLVMLGLPLAVHEPPELQEAMRRLAQNVAAMAEA